MAVADGFDVAYMMKHDLERMTGTKVPLYLRTYILSLLHVITKAYTTTEKLLMIDLNCSKDAYKKKGIEMLGLDRTQNNPTDFFSKIVNGE